ncbi:cystathionine beta-lyase-like [Watersipora subatra]|uniref:cystathionine beta-lyase-like n=1 Tax=Watersipora subatra TaxID=2589382 RepID=UPI00355BF691
MNKPAEPQAFYNGKDVAEMGIGTKLVALTVKNERTNNRPMVTPIYHTTMYKAESSAGFVDQMSKGFGYLRVRNPNMDEAEMTIAQAEGAKGSLVFPSGMAAITSTLMCFLRPGDHVVAQSPLYSCTSYVLDNMLSEFNIEVSYADAGGDESQYRKLVKKNTALLYGETLCNPMMHFLDVKKFAAIGKELKIMTVIDSTFTPPTILRSLDYGVDVVMHSASKYLCGHSDMLAGCVSFNDLDRYEKLRTWRVFIGSSQSPFDSSQLVRSLRTLHVRTERHSENALAVAKFLEQYPLVTKVHYIGLESHPQHAIAASLMKGFGGMLALELKTKEQGVRFAESTKLFRLSVSLGGVESLIEHPNTMTHNKTVVTSDERGDGIPDTLIRLSVGIENVEDQIADLKQALEKCQLDGQT